MGGVHALLAGNLAQAPHANILSTTWHYTHRLSVLVHQGIVTIPGRDIQVPKAPRIIQRMPSFEEQGLCIGATFALAATNGRDFDRRINILGFCQSIDVLNEAVEETVMSRGGEVLEQERKLKSGVHEQVRQQCTCSRVLGLWSPSLVWVFEMVAMYVADVCEAACVVDSTTVCMPSPCGSSAKL
jgi:hypothetical protein